MDVININSFWDEEAGVFVATSDDIPGLATEAGSMEDLITKLKCMIPELLELNTPNHLPKDIPFKIHSQIDAIAHAC